MKTIAVGILLLSFAAQQFPSLLANPTGSLQKIKTASVFISGI
jgi:hypothetical protein